MIKIRNVGVLSLAIFLCALTVSAQKQQSVQVSDAVKSSPAFAEVLVKRTDLESELEALLVEYTDEFPRAKELRYSLSLLQRDSEKLLALKSADAGRLTQALGKLLVRKAELETDLWKLLLVYKDEHPDVKRAKRRVEIYEKAIKQILD